MEQRSDGGHSQIAIIGAGFGGLGAAIKLKGRGFDDLVIFERADDVGGVWRDNQYPGCACDVQSHLYSLSFAPNPDWSHSYSRQPEIWDYLRRIATEHGLLPHIRFGHMVRSARWEPAARRWHIETEHGTYTAAALIVASGALSEPAIPALPGLERFQGKIFHSARWDHSFDLRGRRVAVVGTGASAIQFVPQIQPLVERLYIFQRTPPWILPRFDRPLSLAERRLLARFPPARLALRGSYYLLRELLVLGFRHPRLLRRFEQLAKQHLARSVPDPALRAKLTPDYRIGCKRILTSNDYLPAVASPNVELITEPIAELREGSVVGADGTERAVDAIIFGTGFQVTDWPIAHHIRGTAGLSLADHWDGSPQAHLGTTVAGFPNLFLLQGPNTGLGHTSVLYMIEAQLDHILSALEYMQRHGLATIEPRPEAQAAFVAEVDRRMRGTVWTAGGCVSWYLDRTGRNSTIWPDSTWSFRRRVARMRPAEYAFTPATGHPLSEQGRPSAPALS